MKTIHRYYLGLTLCYIVGAVITPFFGLFIAIVRLAACIGGILVDTFLLVPRIVQDYQGKFWDRQIELSREKLNQN